MATIEVCGGQLCGREDGGVHVFLGVPYAAPPVGDLRFAPPAPVQPWSGVRDATSFGPRAMQPDAPPLVGTGQTTDLMDEDCLRLNVCTPGIDGGRRPVLVWLHGGGLAWGSPNDYDGRTLARDEDVVVVCVGYRLGLLGFADLRECGPELAGSASNGFRDQIAALAWVRDNIAAFGGDPGCVTVVGESGGALSAFALLAAPAAQGLFHRAAALSPGVPLTTPPTVVAPLCDALGVPAARLLAALRGLNARKIVELQAAIGFTSGGSIDGEVVTQLPEDALCQRGAGAVPLLTGTTRDEGTLLTEIIGAQGDEVLPFVAAGLARDTLNGADPTQYLAALRSAHPAATERDLHTIVWTDHFRRAAIRTAAAATDAGSAGWLYRFDLPTTVMDGRLGATHGSDVPFVFNDFARADDSAPLHAGDPRAAAVAARWSATIARFARTGDPNGGGLPEWPPYAADGRHCLVVDAEMSVETDLDRASEGMWGDR